jgi:predicted N-formylglutamate amidohydrolase
MSRAVVLLSCEHGGNRIPSAQQSMFASRRARQALAGHRGLDLGALALARRLARQLGAKLYAVTLSRLLIDLNRSPGHRRQFSEFSRDLPPSTKSSLIQKYYWAHRRRLEAHIRRANDRRIIHVSVHSFTPQLNGQRRNADCALLYDPARKPEQAFCRDWLNRLHEQLPTLRLRRNYPYRGTADGMTTALRRCYPASHYLGIELEINQALLMGATANRDRLLAALTSSLQEASSSY